MNVNPEDAIARLRAAKAAAILGGGKEKAAKIAAQGKLTARQRIDAFVDRDSFVEQYMLAGNPEDVEAGIFGDGVVVGYGKVDKRGVCIYAPDPSVHSGTVSMIHRAKICQIHDTAMGLRVPIVGLVDSPGGRLETPEENSSEFGLGYQFEYRRRTSLSGVVPQLTAILGICSGSAVYGPALSDFIFMVEGQGYMFITGPRAVKEVLGTEPTKEELGSAKVHSRITGLADFVVKSERECFEKIKHLLSFLPSNNGEMPPLVASGDSPDRMDDDLAGIVPLESRKPYDMHLVIRRLVDNGDFLEVKAEFAKNMIVGFGRLNGRSVGIVANQPMVFGGALTASGSDKQARFMRFCDAFNIPILNLVDCASFMPGVDQEQANIIGRGAKVLYALSEATVPKITLLVRKCYGGANLAMSTLKDGGIDQVLAWPWAEGSKMGAEAAVGVLFQKEIAKSANPAEFRSQKISEFQERYSGPYLRAASGGFDAVIEPRETRAVLIRLFDMYHTKQPLPQVQKKHGNIPL